MNNAGRGVSKLVAKLTDDEFDSAMRDNVKSALYGMQTVLPQDGVQRDRVRFTF